MFTEQPRETAFPVSQAGGGVGVGGMLRAEPAACSTCVLQLGAAPWACDAVQDRVGSDGEEGGCERAGLCMVMWPVAWIITIIMSQSMFLWREGGQCCLTCPHWRACGDGRLIPSRPEGSTGFTPSC